MRYEREMTYGLAKTMSTKASLLLISLENPNIKLDDDLQKTTTTYNMQKREDGNLCQGR